MQGLKLLLVAGLALAALHQSDTDAVTRRAAQIGYDGTTITMIDVGDLEQAQAFYADALGLAPEFAVVEYGWAEMRLPSANALLGLSAVETVEPGPSPAFSLGVTDIERTREHLIASGVTFVEDPYEIDGLVKLAVFQDPWGNQVMLHQSLVETSE